jgi:hypothetical protein
MIDIRRAKFIWLDERIHNARRSAHSPIQPGITQALESSRNLLDSVSLIFILTNRAVAKPYTAGGKRRFYIFL